jgi:hypothetical protein
MRSVHWYAANSRGLQADPLRETMALESGADPPKAALLVMEPGALWPGDTLDWAEHVSVVTLSPRQSVESVLRRVSRAATARSMKFRSFECAVVSFADFNEMEHVHHRRGLVRGLGSFLVELGCLRFVLAAHRAERLSRQELIALEDVVTQGTSGRLLVQICFERVPLFGAGHARTRL